MLDKQTALGRSFCLLEQIPVNTWDAYMCLYQSAVFTIALIAHAGYNAAAGNGLATTDPATVVSNLSEWDLSGGIYPDKSADTVAASVVTRPLLQLCYLHRQ